MRTSARRPAIARLWLRAAAAAALASAPAAFAANPGPPPAAPVTAAEQQAIRDAAARGALLYAYDQAAWHGTDAMMAKVSDPGTKIAGWIVDGPAEAPELIFFDKDRADPHAVFIVSFRAGSIASSRMAGAGEAELSSDRRRLVAARQAAMEAFARAKVGRCAAVMNSVVLPPARPGDPALVYFLTPQPDANLIPFGGHYRVSVAGDGKVGEIRPFTNSCGSVPRGPDGNGKPVALVITHLLDPVPTEIHVFSSYVAGMPIYVSTVKNGRLWKVDRDRIELVPRP